MNLLYILLLFSGCIGGESQIIFANEGETAKLNFPYPCNSTRVTLQYANRSPSYSSANPTFISLPSNQFLTNDNDSRQCFLNLTIDPVSRDDAGTYILTAYKDGDILPDYPRIGLRVTYPPGRASCKSSSDHLAGVWIKLYCTAPVGNVAGQIVCYQNGNRLAPYTTPVQNGGILNQVVLARLANHSVRCCSSTSDKAKIEHECNDCGWDPIHDIAIAIPAITDSSSPVSPTVGSNSPKDPTEDGVTLHVLTSPQTKIYVNVPIKCSANSKTGLYIALSFTSLTTIIFSVLYFCMVRELKLKKQKDVSKESDKQQGHLTLQLQEEFT